LLYTAADLYNKYLLTYYFLRPQSILANLYKLFILTPTIQTNEYQLLLYG